MKDLQRKPHTFIFYPIVEKFEDQLAHCSDIRIVITGGVADPYQHNFGKLDPGPH
jgi:hypothetical protein